MTVALVTGANQGLGLAVAGQLAEELPEGSTVYLTGRDPDRVRQAAAQTPGTTGAVLDVGDPESVDRFAELVRAEHGGLDVLVSNAFARRSADRSPAEQIRGFVATNNLGTTRMIRAFRPLVRPNGRFLVVASSFGSLRNLAEPLHPLFDTDRLTLDELDRVMLGYADLVESGQSAAAGWPDSINTVSKIGQVAATRIYAREEDHRDGRFVGAACPGLVDTEASRPWFADMSSALSPQDAARHLVRLVTGEVEPEFYGNLVQYGKVLPWT
ncbi:MAG TPA: SDR family NAD(P)-dependent oxidoreductase [Actinocrinis sp.]|nr:SDR family NAD(P)-dependent oxidoreductase [Actinocrinis sp.]